MRRSSPAQLKTPPPTRCIREPRNHSPQPNAEPNSGAHPHFGAAGRLRPCSESSDHRRIPEPARTVAPKPAPVASRASARSRPAQELTQPMVQGPPSRPPDSEPACAKTAAKSDPAYATDPGLSVGPLFPPPPSLPGRSYLLRPAIRTATPTSALSAGQLLSLPLCQQGSHPPCQQDRSALLRPAGRAVDPSSALRSSLLCPADSAASQSARLARPLLSPLSGRSALPAWPIFLPPTAGPLLLPPLSAPPRRQGRSTFRVLHHAGLSFLLHPTGWASP